ncbi:hypothetical protein [Paenibacillus taichungensis]
MQVAKLPRSAEIEIELVAIKRKLYQEG